MRYWAHLIIDMFVNVFSDVFKGIFFGLGYSCPFEDGKGSRSAVDSKVLVEVKHNLKKYFR